MTRNPTPRALLTRLGIYFGIMIGGIMAISALSPEAERWLPIGGRDAIEMAHLEFADVATTNKSGVEVVESRLVGPKTSHQRRLVFLFLSESLLLAVLVMLPISWTYTATRAETKNHRTFNRALIVLPICATTIVLLIQGSLALAFGLAAMVAAVRFRVRLQEPIDGIYIFAAICVGLAAGIGYMGVAIIMAVFFCFGNTILWMQDNKEDAAH